MRNKQNACFPIHARPSSKIKGQKYKKTSEKRTKNQGQGVENVENVRILRRVDFS
jgi:hypothetical protein